VREIKFRAWIPPLIENGEEVYVGFMVNVDSVDFKNEFINAWTPPSSVADIIYGMVRMRGRDRFWFKDAHHPEQSRPYILMQYVGLKDYKRTEDFPEGQEICEGDILKITQACGEEVTGEVVWDEIHARYSLDMGAELWDFGNIVECEHMIEVIGNCHDNPELLEGVG